MTISAKPHKPAEKVTIDDVTCDVIESRDPHHGSGVPLQQVVTAVMTCPQHARRHRRRHRGAAKRPSVRISRRR
jgi:hypothetical protein